ncbi:uromodulin-like [Protopterus annectens]|uniref:uromodulin-like n=1 Tax=Protopterus annectens TaxID=7888 RepID=UPI001CFAE334|nr:uromodulin-like [Protopterus annectens]
MLLLVLLFGASYITAGFSDSFCFVGVDNATDCGQCNPNATCYRGHTANCTCNPGYFGNGLICKTAIECEKINCCPQGFQWNSTTQCCDQKFCSPVCSNDELCNDAVRNTTGCVCNPLTYASYGDADIVPVLSCQPAVSSIAVSKCLLDKLKLDSSSVHLNDPACIGSSLIIGDQRMTSIKFNQNLLQCGTTIKSNQTHAIFSNTLILEPLSNGIIIINGNGKKIPFSCAYPINMELSLISAINGAISYGNLPSVDGAGSYPTLMSVFKDNDYLSPYSSGPINLLLNSPLYVGAVVQNIENKSLVLVVDNCYATPTNNSSDPTKFTLIDKGCPATTYVNVTILINGEGSEVRLVIGVFKFVNQSQFYLTCKMHLCDATTNCKPSCPARSKALDEGHSVVGTVGPIVVSDPSSSSDSKDPSSSASKDPSSSSASKDFPLMPTICSALMLLLLNRIGD